MNEQWFKWAVVIFLGQSFIRMIRDAIHDFHNAQKAWMMGYEQGVKYGKSASHNLSAFEKRDGIVSVTISAKEPPASELN